MRFRQHLFIEQIAQNSRRPPLDPQWVSIIFSASKGTNQLDSRMHGKISYLISFDQTMTSRVKIFWAPITTFLLRPFFRDWKVKLPFKRKIPTCRWTTLKIVPYWKFAWFEKLQNTFLSNEAARETRQMSEFSIFLIHLRFKKHSPFFSKINHDLHIPLNDNLPWFWVHVASRNITLCSGQQLCKC